MCTYTGDFTNPLLHELIFQKSGFPSKITSKPVNLIASDDQSVWYIDSNHNEGKNGGSSSKELQSS